jgi:hypothetical protein
MSGEKYTDQLNVDPSELNARGAEIAEVIYLRPDQTMPDLGEEQR